MITFTAIAIHKDGSVISQGGFASAQEAYDTLRFWLEDWFYNSPKSPLVKFFVANETDGLAEYTEAEIRELGSKPKNRNTNGPTVGTKSHSRAKGE